MTMNKKQTKLILLDSAKKKLATMTTEERRELINQVLEYLQKGKR